VLSSSVERRGGNGVKEEGKIVFLGEEGKGGERRKRDRMTYS
jgi:hypothetical protein